jgi:hypothetical protein
MEMLKYSDIEERIADWAGLHQDIRAVIILGSRGSRDPNASRAGSDLDVLIVASSAEWYRTRGTDWCSEISPVLVCQYQNERHMVFERSDDYYVIFKPDLDVDFSIVSRRYIRQETLRAKWFLRFPSLSPVPDKTLQAEASAFRPGFRVLLDRDLLAQDIVDSLKRIPWLAPLPGESEFLFALDEFLICTFKAVKKAHSSRLFHAKWMCDTTLKMQLIRMAKWHVHSRQRQVETTRHTDLAVDEWADPRVIGELPQTFASFDSGDIYRALYASLGLFYWVAAETSQSLGYQDTLAAAVDRIEWLREYIESKLTLPSSLTKKRNAQMEARCGKCSNERPNHPFSRV